MTASRTRRCGRFGLAALMVAAAAVPAPRPAHAGGVVTMSLESDIDPAAAGAIDPDAAGLPGDLWRGADRAETARLIAGLPGDQASPALRDLTRRTLAVAAPPPAGSVVAPGLVETRARALLRMGEAELAADLMAAVSKTRRGVAGDRLLLEASLLTQDRAGACAVARDRAGQIDEIVFAKTAAFCEALSGDRDRAEFIAALIAERAPDDGAFFALLDLMTGAAAKPGRAISRLDDASPLHLAMLRAVGLPPPDPSKAPSKTQAAPSVDDLAAAKARKLATNPAAPLDLRMLAMWRALAANRADFAAAGQLFAALAVDPKAAPKGPAGEIPRLYAKAMMAQSGPDRTTALAQLLFAGEEAGVGAAVARLAQPLLADVLPLASRPDIAGRIARGLLLADEFRLANRWLASLQAAGTVPGARDQAALLVELTAVAGARDSRTFAGPETALWLGAVGRVGSGRGEPNVARMAMLLMGARQAVGLPVPAALDAAAKGWRPERPVSPLALAPLRAAAGDGRVGETALRAAHLVDVESAGDRPYRMVEAAGALGQVGLIADARRLAIEALIAGGL